MNNQTDYQYQPTDNGSGQVSSERIDALTLEYETIAVDESFSQSCNHAEASAGYRAILVDALALARQQAQQIARLQRDVDACCIGAFVQYHYRNSHDVVRLSGDFTVKDIELILARLKEGKQP